MKKIFSFCLVAFLLTSCKPETTAKETNTENVDCPQTNNYIPSINVNSRQDFFELFNFFIQDIVNKQDTITFKTINHDLIFCKSNEKWTIEKGTFTKKINETQDYEKMMQELANPQYKTIKLNDEVYEYRVLLNPSPFPNFQEEANEVVFQLIKPEKKEPQTVSVYTLEQTKNARAGVQLGLPNISATVVHNDQIYWAISPEQGEGNGGIASIVNYDSKTDKINVIQPEQIQTQQINDLVVSGDNNLTFWLALQMSGEGNPYYPSMGLASFSLQNNSFNNYHVRNSNIVGAIPSKLMLENEFLWVGTGNGICRIEWQNVEQDKSWNCWKLTLESDVSNSQEIPVYSTSLDNESIGNLEKDKVEVLWWMPIEENSEKGRYEIKYDKGIEITLDNQGGNYWQEFEGQFNQVKSWDSPIYWVANDWYWRGNKFIRSFDSVPLNYVGGGPTGINLQAENFSYPFNVVALRGDLDLLNITKNSTTLKYYSAWVDDELLSPYLTIVPQSNINKKQKNPLSNIEF